MTARRMVLDREDIDRLLTMALTKVSLPAGCEIALEGSIAEGFGNPGSDVDFLVLVHDTDQPTMPTVLFIDGRRVEVRTRSVRQVAEQFDSVLAVPGEDALNRCQRVLGAVPLRGEDLLRRVRSRLPAEEFAWTVSAWFADRARHALRYANAMAQLEQPDEAADWMHVGLLYSAKSWAARHGETYIEPKWLPAQLSRVERVSGTGQEVVRRYWSLRDVGAGQLARCVDLAEDFGVDGCRPVVGGALVRQVDEVTTWPIGDRVHVVRDRSDVFVLDESTGRIWQSIVFGRPLAEPLAGGAGRGAVLARFIRLGLVGLSWPGGGPITPVAPLCPPVRPVTPPPSGARPVLSLLGGTVAERVPVSLMPLPAKRFCAAALDLVWSNVLVENAREDTVGALAAYDARLAEITARRMLQVACRGLFSAAGIHPLPPDSTLVRSLAELPCVEPELVAQAQRLDRLTAADSPGWGAAALNALDRFVALVRTATGATGFPSSFASAAGWQRTIEVGHDWLRMGAYLGADLPIDEARDLLANAGPRAVHS